MARKIQVEIVGDAKSLERAFKRAGNAGDGFSRKMSGLSKVIGAGIGGGVLAFGFAMRRGFKELSNAQKVAAQTNAVLRSTGGIANVTAQRVNKLATSLSRMSGMDDEEIAAMENLLLTFTNIRNGAGKNEKVFDKATEAVLDLSVATGKDLNSSAIMVGKALNDLEVNSRGTITGWSALRRVGVMVTADMMRQGAAFIKAGKPMEAQKLLLKELQTEFGGSARAFGTTMPGALGRLRNAFDELAAAFAEGFLPVILRVSGALTKKLADPAFITRVKELGTLIGTKLYNAFVSISQWFEAHWGGIQSGFQSVAGFARGFKNALTRIVQVTPGGEGTLLGLILSGVLLTKIAKIAYALAGISGLFMGGGGRGGRRGRGRGGRMRGLGSGKLGFGGLIAAGILADNYLDDTEQAPAAQPKSGASGGGRGRKRALGGPVIAGMSYLVGERGPEMFTPRNSGTITPGGGAGGAGATHIHVHVGSHKVAEAIIGDIQRIGKRGTAQQRGRWGGQNLALG